VIDEAKPLAGRRVVVTRPRAQASEFMGWLEAQGAEAVAFPAIRVVDPPDTAPLARAAAEVRSFDWLVFTSVNGVKRFWEALAAAQLDAGALAGARVAAIGPATAAALQERGVKADVVPERYVAEGVVDALGAAEDMRGRRVLLPRAAGAREVLPERLRQMGAVVTEVEAYRAVADATEATDLRWRLASGDIDAVTFTSSSTVRNFVAAVGTEIGGAAVACIGPVTAETARELGLPVTVVAAEHTIPGLEAVLLELFAAEREPLPKREQ
jgi:uroporphyrinogen III methyltransferase/synthase